MKPTLSRRHALFATTLAMPLFLQNASAAVGKAKRKQGTKEGPLHRAIKELSEAKIYLEKANHDFGGHKEHAVKDIEAALKALHAALEFEEKKGA